MDKPAEGFVKLRRGRFGQVTIYVCEHCAARMKKTKTQKDREDFGKEMSERNRAMSSNRMLGNTNQKGAKPTEP
jgi:hypothetical protein